MFEAVINPNDGGRTPLHLTARWGHPDVALVLLSHGADVNATDGNGRSLLHEAALHGHEDVVEVLLESGADVSLKVEGGETALHLAARVDSMEMVKRLLEHGADVNAQTKDSWTALHIAISHWGHSARSQLVARVLLAAGARTDLETNEGKTALDLASETPHLVELLQAGPRDAETGP